MGYLGGALEGFSSHYKKRKKKPVSEAKDAGSTAGSAAGGAANSIIGSFKKGGRVKRTGNYRLHAGERVLNKRQARRARRSKSR